MGAEHKIEDEERCDKCVYFKQLYVPPIKAYKDIPKDGYICTVFGCEDSIMWLGTGEKVRSGMCEMFKDGG